MTRHDVEELDDPLTKQIDEDDDYFEDDEWVYDDDDYFEDEEDESTTD